MAKQRDTADIMHDALSSLCCESWSRTGSQARQAAPGKSGKSGGQVLFYCDGQKVCSERVVHAALACLLGGGSLLVSV